MPYATYTQIGSLTVQAQQHNQGDWEVLFPDGTIEIWNNNDFTNQWH